MYNLLLSPLELRGLTLKNRIAFAPTTMGLSPAERAERLRGVARGGAALVILGDVGVEPLVHRSGFDILTDEGRAACRTLVADLHACGAKVSAQLFAPDYDVAHIRALASDPTVDRAQISAAMRDGVGAYVTEMDHVRIERLAGLFGEAAAQARALGFDMVQVHGDRLVGSFSSQVYNHRADHLGAGSRGRAAFGAAAVREVRRAVGDDFPIDYKLAVRQPQRGLGKTGPAVDELPTFVAELEAAGVDAFHVTGANHSALEDTVPSRNHPVLAGEGCFLNLAAAVSDLARVPVCGVGKLQTPAFIERELERGTMDWAALSRQLLADPDWPAKVAAGQPDAIVRCTYCNRRCMNSLRTREPFGCVFDQR